MSAFQAAFAEGFIYGLIVGVGLTLALCVTVFWPRRR